MSQDHVCYSEETSIPLGGNTLHCAICGEPTMNTEPGPELEADEQEAQEEDEGIEEEE